MSTAPPPLSVEGLTIRFGDRVALRDVSLSVRPGEFVALTGPNGSGKTTLLRAALGLVAPAAGVARLGGSPIDGLPIRERARRVAWVPQEELPRDNVPVSEYVLFGRYAHLPAWSSESAEDRRRSEAAIAEVGLSDRSRSGVLELSGGERQRVVLARALAQATPLLLLDEPTAHLDIGFQLELLDRVRRLTRPGGRAVVAAMHDLNLAVRFADRIVVLSHGRVAADGPSQEVLSEALLRAVWGVSAELRTDATTGLPYLLPRVVPPAPTDAAPRPPKGAPLRVHVVGGGGAAGPILRALSEEGFAVTSGTLHLLDSDFETATELGMEVAAEAPFAPIGEEARRRNRSLIAAAEAVVIAPFYVGPSNLANLQDVSESPSPPVFLFSTPPWEPRDFTGGAAFRAITELRGRGIREVGSVDELVEQLRAFSRSPSRAHAAAMSAM